MRYSTALSASLTRRRLVTLGGAAALWSIFGRPAKAQPPGRRPTIGVNSYSVRASMTGHAQSTLRQLKHIGFEEVELVGEKELDRATPMSRQLGLEVLSLHVWDLFDPGAPNAVHASAAETLAGRWAVDLSTCRVFCERRWCRVSDTWYSNTMWHSEIR